MAFRIVKINNRCKLEVSLNYLVYRGNEEFKILLDEISLLIIENQQVCITVSLLSELMNHKIRVIFCDKNHNPQGELEVYNGCYNTSAKIKTQLNWNEKLMKSIWTNIVKQKIYNQMIVLEKLKKVEAEKLNQYIKDVIYNDETNREGTASKVYFNSLFGLGFNRRDDKIEINKYLNYGYSILLSAINREISIFGYLNYFGIHHIGETNYFNLGCDLIEPFRPFVDLACVENDLNDENYKKIMINTLNTEVLCNNKIMILSNAIHLYCQSVLGFLSSEITNGLVTVTFKNE